MRGEMGYQVQDAVIYETEYPVKAKTMDRYEVEDVYFARVVYL